MKYMLLIYGAESEWTEAERLDCMEKSGRICDELASQGKLVSASPLQPIFMATSVRVRGGQRLITDGPFAETVEQLGGYYILEVSNLDEAISIASILPPAKKGTVEIRPLFPLPEAKTNHPDFFQEQLLINAPVETLYNALTTQRGLEGWWTTTCTVSENVGAEVSVAFGETYKRFRIEALEFSSKVVWECTDSHLVVPGQSMSPSEWVGTRIEFRLAEANPVQTQLNLRHHGLVPEFQCYEICSGGWKQFLASLKQYCETGSGTPFGGSEK